MQGRRCDCFPTLFSDHLTKIMAQMVFDNETAVLKMRTPLGEATLDYQKGRFDMSLGGQVGTFDGRCQAKPYYFGYTATASISIRKSDVTSDATPIVERATLTGFFTLLKNSA
jgi:hypothetical protein